MSKCGIICEYNPFHNGHKHHISRTKEITGADIICVMSGDFTQRAAPAVFDKLVRAKAALSCGADAVLELPVLYSTAPAQRFAYGAIKIMSFIKDLDFLSFGVETDNTDLLQEIAEIQAKEPPEMSAEILRLAKSGLSYPDCLAAATAEFLGGGLQKSDQIMSDQIKSEVLQMLSQPNNVLAIEYLKAIFSMGLSIKPVFVRRTDNGYNSPVLQPPFAAAGAIRSLIESGQDYSAFVPYPCGISPVDNRIFEAFLRDALLRHDINYDEGLGVKLKKAALDSPFLSDIIQRAKSKRYTYSRIKRLIFGTMLDIDSGLYDYNGDFFFRVLGVRKSFCDLLGDLGQNAVIRHADIPAASPAAAEILALDRRASDIYSTITSQPATRFFSKLLVV